MYNIIYIVSIYMYMYVHINKKPKMTKVIQVSSNSVQGLQGKS